MKIRRILIALLCAVCALPSADATFASCNGSAARAFATAAELRSNFFDPSTGLYNLSLWWESANALEAVSNLILFESGDHGVSNPAFLRSAETDIATMFERTQNVSLNVSGSPGPVSTTLSGYFDDEGWWGHSSQASGWKGHVQKLHGSCFLQHGASGAINAPQFHKG